MPTGSYPGCCLLFTGISSGGISSRVSRSVRSGNEDGSKTRCAFHGGVSSSVVGGITCAFDGDARPSTSAVAGHCTFLKRAIFGPQRSCCVFERVVCTRSPIFLNAVNAKALITHRPSREALMSAENSEYSIVRRRPESHRAFAHKIVSVDSVHAANRPANDVSRCIRSCGSTRSSRDCSALQKKSHRKETTL